MKYVSTALVDIYMSHGVDCCKAFDKAFSVTGKYPKLERNLEEYYNTDNNKIKKEDFSREYNQLMDFITQKDIGLPLGEMTFEGIEELIKKPHLFEVEKNFIYYSDYHNIYSFVYGNKNYKKKTN